MGVEAEVEGVWLRGWAGDGHGTPHSEVGTPLGVGRF